QKCQRNRRYGSVAHSRSTWIAQSASIPLAKSTSWSAANLKLDPESLRARILVAFGFRLLQVWSHTIRFEIEDRGKILQAPVSERFIGAAWHNRLLLLPFAIRRFIKQRQGARSAVEPRIRALLETAQLGQIHPPASVYPSALHSGPAPRSSENIERRGIRSRARAPEVGDDGVGGNALIASADVTMAKLIDGRAIAERVYAELRDEVASLKSRGATPGLAVVLVGDDPASRAYVRAKDK